MKKGNGYSSNLVNCGNRCGTHNRANDDRQTGRKRMVLSDEIRAARQKHGWSQSALALEAGVSRPTVARVELGHDVSTATLGKVAAALELKLELRANDES